MNTRQAGFTLIELVMVIVILGILAAVAVPKFVNLQGDAQQAAVEGIAGALGSASAINYAVRSVDTAKGTAVANCTDLANALEGGLDADYNIQAGVIAAGTVVTCTVELVADTTKNATIPSRFIPKPYQIRMPGIPAGGRNCRWGQDLGGRGADRRSAP